jgi:isocitrate dehydrogenase
MNSNRTTEVTPPSEETSNRPVPVAVAPGDGIGPEIMAATLRVLQAAGAGIEPRTVEEKAQRLETDGWRRYLES